MLVDGLGRIVVVGWLLGAVVAGCAAPDESSSVAGDEPELRALSAAEILGEIAYGETKGPIAYTRRPRLRAYTFTAAAGDRIKVEATSSSAAGVTVLVANDRFQDVPGNTNATLASAGKYYVAFRSADLADAQITIKLTRTNAPSAKVADVAVGPYGTCARLATGQTRCWGRIANDYFATRADDFSDKTPATGAMPADHAFLPAHGTISFAFAGTIKRSWDVALERAQEAGGRWSVTGAPLWTSVGSDAPSALLSRECGWFGDRVRCANEDGTFKDFDFGGEKFASGGVGSRRDFACAVTPAGAVKCWGENVEGRLGTGDVADIGIGDPDQDANADLTALAPIDLGPGAIATAVALGEKHACALLQGGQVKCWGSGELGQLGRGVMQVGTHPWEMGASLPAVPLEAAAIGVYAFGRATCAALANAELRCFGVLPSWLPTGMTFSSPVKKLVISAGAGAYGEPTSPHACALLEDESLRCWGKNGYGALGLAAPVAELRYDYRVGASSLPAIEIP